MRISFNLYLFMNSKFFRKLRRHESHICWLALSRLESAHALSQLLSELHQAPAAEEEQQKMLSEVPSSASLSSMAGSSSQLPTVPDSPTSSVASAPMKESTSVSNKPTVHINRMLNFSSLNEKVKKMISYFTNVQF